MIPKVIIPHFKYYYIFKINVKKKLPIKLHIGRLGQNKTNEAIILFYYHYYLFYINKAKSCWPKLLKSHTTSFITKLRSDTSSLTEEPFMIHRPFSLIHRCRLHHVLDRNWIIDLCSSPIHGSNLPLISNNICKNDRYECLSLISIATYNKYLKRHDF